MKTVRLAIAAVILALPFSMSMAADLRVKITPEISSLTVKHNGKDVTIQREQKKDATVVAAFTRTSRPCPPFCIQPAIVAPGVETIAEIEVLDYLKRMNDGDDSILLIDSRTPDWIKRGTIPGAINVPWTTLNISRSDPLAIVDTLANLFNVHAQEDLYDFSKAKTLVMFCNGMWCGQSPNNIKSLLKIGYPAHKIKWYRGGMQDWSMLGLTTVPGK